MMNDVAFPDCCESSSAQHNLKTNTSVTICRAPSFLPLLNNKQGSFIRCDESEYGYKIYSTSTVNNTIAVFVWLLETLDLKVLF